MFFRFPPTLARATVILLLGVLLGSCGMRIDSLGSSERARQSTPVPNSGASGCLAGAGDRLSRFWRGKATASEMEALWTCASESLDLFLVWVRGKKGTNYSPKELRSFLQTYFLQEYPISDELMHEAMELKHLFVGGSNRLVTLADIRKTQRVIQVLRRLSLDLLPEMPLPFSTTGGPMTEDRVFQLIQALKTGAGALVSAMEVSGASYSLQNFGEFIRLLDQFPKGVSEEESSLSWIKAKLPLIAALKSAMIGGAEDPVVEPLSGAQWGRVLRIGLDAYYLYLRFLYLSENYRIQDFPVGYVGQVRKRFVNWASDSLMLIASAVARRPDRVIPYTTVDKALSQIDWSKWGLDVGSVTRLLRVFNQKIFKSGSNVGLTSSTFSHLWVYLNDWNMGQQQLELDFKVGEGDSASGAAASFERFQVGDYNRLPGIGVSSSSAGRPAELSEILLHPSPFFVPNQIEVNFNGRSIGVPDHSFPEMAHLHWMNLLIKVLNQSYGTHPKLGTKAGGLRAFYDDMREVGVRLKVFDSKDSTVPEKRFREANLFLPSSDGNEFLSPQEGLELLAYLVSTKAVMTRVHKALTDRRVCGALPQKDAFDWPMIDADCFRRSFYSNLRAYFPQVPGVVNYYNGLKFNEQLQFQAALEASARKGTPKASDPIESGDLEGIVAIFQYVETVFQKFDFNVDNVIDDVEVQRAFPVFQEIIRGLAQARNPGKSFSSDELLTVFRFCLFYGRPPTDQWDILFSRPFFKVNATRGTLIALFAAVTGAPTP